ncbi:MAG TPA: hypothetical protein VFB80_18380 [Pirellulaceae bacterium]|nr:hypothetical protein [Pirellulaceae bacterium]
MKILCLPLLAAAGALLLASCSNTPSNMCAVRGTLTYKGQPMPQVFLKFEPDDLTKKSTSMAVTDASGKFEMAIGSTPGVYKGKVKVTCDDPLAAMGTKTPVPKEVETAYRELCAKYGTGKSTYEMTIDKPLTDLKLALD